MSKFAILVQVVAYLLSCAALAVERPTILGRIQLELDSQPGAKQYEIELEDQRKGAKRSVLPFKEGTPLFDLRVPVGKYMLRARVYDSRGISGPWSKPEVVLVTPTAEQSIVAPKVLTEDGVNPESLTWKENTDALVTGKLEYQRLLAKDWTTVAKIEKIEGNSWKIGPSLAPGRYRWTMKFVDEVLGESKATEFIFIMKPTAADLLSIDREIAVRK